MRMLWIKINVRENEGAITNGQSRMDNPVTLATQQHRTLQ